VGSPRWILSHLLVAGLVVLMVNLGFWQLRRLDEKRDFNALVRSRQDEPVVPLDEVPEDAAAYRRVTVTGRYDVEREVIVRGRSLNGQPGVWVLTPLAGAGVIVNRGFLPSAGVPDEVPEQARPTPGEVTVTGMLRPSQTSGRLAASGEAEGIVSIARADVAWLDEQVAYDLHPSWLALEEQRPAAPSELPVPIPEPELDDGPHLGYAVQWFTFSVIAVVGYVLVLRRQVRQ
jgi:surfeit locus 1 family protein